MQRGQLAVTRATAAVFASGRRAGSAVLVSSRYLVTAAHVLLCLDPGTGARVPTDQVELEFPGQAGRLAASRLPLGPASREVDVAVLDLGQNLPGWLPVPVPVWPAARLPDRVKVFGYPLAEGPLNVVWRQFAVSGSSTAATVQLDWPGEVGTFPGHSGGPVVDNDGHALVGILVEGSGPGRFDRFVPVTLIDQVWPGLPRPWLVTGPDPGEARSHFTRRALGQRSVARGGDLFRGRHTALAAIGGWLAAGEPPGQALVITGEPGAGKSAVLARAALSSEAEHGGPGLAFHARAATIGDFLTAVADLTGLDIPASADELVTALADLPGQQPVPVVLDALDEAASDHDRRQITAALADLAVLPGLRVAVATRPLAVGNPYTPGGLLPALGVTSRGDRNLVDLDSDTYIDPAGLHRFAAALLAQDGMDRPGPPGAAWTHYRVRAGLRDRLAAVIAQRAKGNFLVAAMAAVPLSAQAGVIDPSVPGFVPATVPSGVGDALHKYLDRLPSHRRESDRGRLTALAYARGAGLDDRAWLAFAAALSYSTTVADLDTLRRSPAADYLLQTTSAERGARPVTRLFHQALADELLAGRHQISDESALMDMLLGQAEDVGWQDRYLREHAAEHATTAGRLDQLLEDPHYLLSADPARLVPHLDTARSAPARAAAATYRQSAHLLGCLDQLGRASQLELTAHRLGCLTLAAGIADAAPDRPWQTLWSHGSRVVGQVLTGHHASVQAVATGVLPDGTPVIVSSSYDGTVRVWRLADGAPVGEPLAGHDNLVNAVATGVLPDGTSVIVSGGGDSTVRVWRLADGTPVGEPLTGHSGTVQAVATGVLPDGTPVIVSSSHGSDGAVRVWRLTDGAPVGQPLVGSDRWINAVATGVLPDGTPVIVSGSADGTVRVWRLADSTPFGQPLVSHTSAVHMVAVGVLPDGTPVIVSSGSYDGTVRAWRLADGTPVGQPMTGHDSLVTVATGVLPDGTPVIVSSDNGGTVRVWRLADGTPVGQPITGLGGGVAAVAVGTLADGTPVIVTGGGDSTVRVWRLADGTPVGQPLIGHSNWVAAVATGVLPDGTSVIVSGSADCTVRVWRLADGTPVGQPLAGHGGVNAVATGVLPDGAPVIVSGSVGGTVQVWRLADGTQVRGPQAGHGGEVNAVATGVLPDGTPVIVSGGDDGTVRVWRLADGIPLVPPLELSGSVPSVAIHGKVIIAATGASIAVHQPALPRLPCA